MHTCYMARRPPQQRLQAYAVIHQFCKHWRHSYLYACHDCSVRLGPGLILRWATAASTGPNQREESNMCKAALSSKKVDHY